MVEKKIDRLELNSIEKNCIYCNKNPKKKEDLKEKFAHQDLNLEPSVWNDLTSNTPYSPGTHGTSAAKN